MGSATGLEVPFAQWSHYFSLDWVFMEAGGLMHPSGSSTLRPGPTLSRENDSWNSESTHPSPGFSPTFWRVGRGGPQLQDKEWAAFLCGPPGLIHVLLANSLLASHSTAYL